jgi:hypothetical protein
LHSESWSLSGAAVHFQIPPRPAATQAPAADREVAADREAAADREPAAVR